MRDPDLLADAPRGPAAERPMAVHQNWTEREDARSRRDAREDGWQGVQFLLVLVVCGFGGLVAYWLT